jgi:hypothetical protein
VKKREKKAKIFHFFLQKSERIWAFASQFDPPPVVRFRSLELQIVLTPPPRSRVIYERSLSCNRDKLVIELDRVVLCNVPETVLSF